MVVSHLLDLAQQAHEKHSAIIWPPQVAALCAVLPPLNRVLEIGTLFGGTLWLWSQLAEDDARLLSIDNGTDGIHNIELAHKAQQIEALIADSAIALPQVEKWFDGEPIDFLFIDGDHSREAIIRDYETYRHLVRPGGIIGFDDVTHYLGGKPAWDEISSGTQTAMTIWPSCDEGFGKAKGETLNLFGVGVLFV